MFELTPTSLLITAEVCEFVTSFISHYRVKIAANSARIRSTSNKSRCQTSIEWIRDIDAIASRDAYDKSTKRARGGGEAGTREWHTREEGPREGGGRPSEGNRRTWRPKLNEPLSISCSFRVAFVRWTR